GAIDDGLPLVRGPFTMPDSILDACTDGQENVSCDEASTETGQDGHVRIAVPAPVDLGDVVFDDITRLAWEPGARLATLADAEAHCQSLADSGHGGFDDWHVPSMFELATTLNMGQSSAVFLPQFESYPQNHTFWTSDLRDGVSITMGGNWPIHARRSPGFEGATLIRCVAGHPPDPGYAVVGDGVRDARTGLEWQRSDSGTVQTWESALAYCEALALNDRTDWRLPSYKELASIVDYSQAVTIPSAFTDTDADWYWSSSPQRDNAFPISFADGEGTLNRDQTVAHQVRCVRGPDAWLTR
ncbi:MAG: DUF1566 domain-containing protein, partial [Myxococcota bacterium]